MMRVICLGGGPGGLYFASLLKLARPEISVQLIDRNLPSETFGFGVVFSDASLAHIREEDPEIYQSITSNFAYWDAIDVIAKGERIRSEGHGFCGLSRRRLLELLSARAESLGVELSYGVEVSALSELPEADLIVAADGLNSLARESLSATLEPTIEWGRSRFVWLGTTQRFEAFTFIFKEDQHGLWQVHAYEYENERSTFIVETSEDVWRRAGLAEASEDETVTFLEALFAEELEGHRLEKNRSIWRRFPTVSSKAWHQENVVLLGDAIHTAHFSIGSGTKLALEGAAALAHAVAESPTMSEALLRYERERRPAVEQLQRAAEVSRWWFEEADRYHKNLSAEEFTYSLLTRSLRVTHEGLRIRDPAYVQKVERHFADEAYAAAGESAPADAPPPLFTPFKIAGLRLSNRVVLSPMCQYRAEDGYVNDWHMVHLGSRAVGGAGLLLCEMSAVSEEGRITPGCAGLYEDGHTEAWARIVRFVHAESEAKIGIQIGHAGRKGACSLPWVRGGAPLNAEERAWPLVSASPLAYDTRSQCPSELDELEMHKVIRDHVAAARRALKAGFDWLELHFAHGYLLASFLSPVTNQRSDHYGGTLENRLRFPLALLQAVRACWPEGRPLSVRISASDWMEGGLTETDLVEIGRAFQAAGADALNLSSGQTDPRERPRYGRLFQLRFSELVKQALQIPTLSAGGISAAQDVNSILTAKRADLCLLARAHLYDPYWTRHAAREFGHRSEWPAPYKALDRFTPRMEWSPEGRPNTRG
ncbi:MAG: FAD-dependent monooxygenase [Myxococcota bacterium]|nr:FAD-dependent monooxygenase [Myxococcota bacterium]